MNKSDDCRKYRELFPLNYNGSLESGLSGDLRSHLQECSSCRTTYQREQPLFAMAGAEGSLGGFDSHPDGDMLDQYVGRQNSLDAAQRAELEAHLSECRLCREACEKLAGLPEDLADLAPIDELPVMASCDRATEAAPATGEVTYITRRIWRPLAALAVAAVVVVIAVTMLDRRPSEPSATVEVTFPVTVRDRRQPIVFEVKDGEFAIKGRLPVDPEGGHTYSLQVRTADTDSLLHRADRIVDFDELGYTWFETTMTPGVYRLTLYDVVGADSLKVVWPFELRLAP